MALKVPLQTYGPWEVCDPETPWPAKVYASFKTKIGLSQPLDNDTLWFKAKL